MRNAVRRRLAAGGGLLSAALVAGLLVTATPAQAAARTDARPVNNTTQRLVFTTDESVPLRSLARLSGPSTSVVPGATGSTTATSTVDMNNDLMQRMPSINVDFANPDPVSGEQAGPGPVDPGLYSVVFRPGPLSPGETGDLSVCDRCFSVTTPTPPTVTSSDVPGVEANGGSGVVELRGTGFARSTLVEVLRPDGAAPDVVVSAPRQNGATTPTTLRRTFTTTSSATGVRDLRLTNTDGQTTLCRGCFTVLGASVSSVSPSSAANTAPIDLTFTSAAGSFSSSSAPSLQYDRAPFGSGSTASLSIPGTNIRPSSDGSSLVATFDLTGAAPGTDAYLPTVTTGGRTSVSSMRFSVVQQNDPTVSGVAPNTGQAGREQIVQVAGTGFAKGAEVVFERSTGTPLMPSTESVRATRVEYRSPSVLIASVTFPSATSGAFAVRVTNTNARSGVCASPCYTVTAASPTPSASSTGSPSATPSATASATPSRSATPTATASPSRSATPTASASPSPTQTRPTVSLDVSTITSQQKAVVRGTAQPGSRVQLQAYSRPSTTYVAVRETSVGPDGRVVFEVMPSGNTRLFLRQLAAPGSPQVDSTSVVLSVRTSINLKVTRTAAKTYRFTGSTLPKRRGQLVTVFYQAAGSDRVIASRARVSQTGTYNVTRTFSGNGTFTLFTATGTDINNLGNESNRVRTTLR